MAGCISGMEQQPDGLVIFNGGESPRQRDSRLKCCGICPIGAKFSGIPEGTPRVPPQEEQEILARWRGHWKLTMLSTGNIGGNIVAFTDGYIDGNILGLSGGMHNTTEYIDDGRALQVATANAPQRQRLSLWRGADHVLYVDNTGSRLDSESPIELRLTNSIGFGIAMTRPAGQSIPVVTATVVSTTAGGPLDPVAVPVFVGTQPMQMERGESLTEGLQKLADLRAQGALNEEEYTAAKQKLLAT